MNGKVALVTGGALGIGRASALLFARRGAAVVVADVAEEAGHETVSLLDGPGTFVLVDTRRAADVERAVATCLSDHGRLDYVHNNAAVSGSGRPVHETTEEDWERIVGIDLKGAWLVLKHSLIAMRARSGGGAIVNTTSVGAHAALAGSGAYSAAKAGLAMLTRVAALESGDAGIRVNAVAPGMVATAMTSAYANESGAYPPPGPGPLGRMATPEEIAEAAVWLCSDAASFVNGVSLTVDGGWTVAPPVRPPKDEGLRR